MTENNTLRDCVYILDFFFFPAFERNLFSACLQRENLQWGKKLMEEYTLLWQIMELSQGNMKLFFLFPFPASVLCFLAD